MFEQQLLEYFLLLFPCPKLVFNLRVDWQRLRRAAIEPVKQRRRSTGDIAERTTADEITNKVDYAAVPVHRQNCFIGKLPPSSATSTTAAAASVSFSASVYFLGASLRRQSCFLRQRQEQQPPETATAKRMRLNPQTNKRRSASSQAALLLATEPKRFIRI